jgi:uncharacterized membrane-anchored protein
MRRSGAFRTFVLFLLCLLIGPTVVFAQGKPEYHPVLGPKPAMLGSGVGSIAVPEGMAFFDARDTRRLMSEGKEIVHGDEVGALVPIAEDAEWSAVISYNRIGYVKDEEADRLNADDILDSIKEGTATDNEERAKQGAAPIEVVRWGQPPRYDKKTHTLTWSIVARERQDELLNYSAVVLGRFGILTCTVATGAGQAQAMQANLQRISSSIAFAQKQDYSAWRSGDRVSDMTLTGLVAGGAGAAAYGAAKVGLLAKLGKWLVVTALALKKAAIVFLAGLWAAIRAFFRRFRKGKPGEEEALEAAGGPAEVTESAADEAPGGEE